MWVWELEGGEEGGGESQTFRVFFLADPES